jgi:hypothetical protein
MCPSPRTARERKKKEATQGLNLTDRPFFGIFYAQRSKILYSTARCHGTLTLEEAEMTLQ